MAENEKSMKEKLDILLEDKLEKDKAKFKERRFKIPAKARVNRERVKKGYITVMTFKGNRNVDFVKKQIIGGTIKLEDKEPQSIHALRQEDMFFYKNKPILLQPKANLNPWNPLAEKNETYGQPLVMARMEGDKLTTKKGFGKTGWIVGIVILVIIGYAFITGG